MQRGRAPGLPFRGLVRINERGTCPVCGKRHAACDNPTSPPDLYPPVDLRTIPLRPELRFNPPAEEREAAMPLVRAMDLTGRPQMAAGDYVANRRLYLNAEGQVVERGDPSATTLLVGEGGVVPAQRARELGLVSEEQQGNPKGSEYVVHGPGPDDPGAFYDDGTPNTPAGNEGFSDVRSPRESLQKSDAQRAAEAARPQHRVTESMAGSVEDSGLSRGETAPSGRVPDAGSVRSGGEVPASQDKAANVGNTVGEPSGSGEDEQARRAAEDAESKAEDLTEDKAQSGPRRGRPRSGSEAK